MEELRDPHPAERARNGTARSLCGCGERPGSSAAERMGDYTEIFGGFASSCSIPVLVLPETMDGYGEALAGPKSLNYLEIFGALDAWSVPMSYEELVSMEKGSKEEDNRFQEETNVGLVETEASVLDAKVLIEDHITFTKVNQASSSFHSHLDKEQPNISGRTSQQRIVDEAKSKIFLSGPLFNYEPNFEAEAVSSTGSIKDESPKNFGSYDHIIHRDIEEEKERGKQKEILNGCFVGATVDDSKNDLKDDHESSGYSLPDGNTENLKQHSRSSSYHSTSSGDVTFSDYAFLTISDINLRTQPLQVPPPSRAPPSLDRNTEKFKSEALEASNATFNKELIPETYKSYNSHHIGGPRTRHALKETVKTNSHTNLNVEVDASSAAAASAAAMKEAMEQAQASLKSAKELMERKRDSPQNGLRQDPHDFRTWNEQNINFTGRSRYKTKIAKKVVPNQLERVNSAFSEDIEEAIQGKGSRFKLSLDENERSHEWKVDKQFYELIGNEKLMRTREMNDERYNSNEEIKLVHQLSTNQFFPEKEAFGKQRKMFSQSENDNEVKKLNKYRISEKTSYSGGGLHLPDGNAKKLKLANRVDNEKIPDILETSATPSVQGDDEDKQKAGPVLKNFNGRKVKVEDTNSLIQRDKNENELKEFKESHTYGVGKKNEGDNKEHNTFGWNDSGFPDFYDNRKLEEFDVGEPVGKKLGQGIECNQIHGASINSEYDSLNNYEHMEHSSRVYNSNVTYEFTLNKNIEVKLSNLQNANEVEINAENRTSVSIDKEKNLEDLREECHLGKFKKTRRDGYIENYIKEKDSELEDIDNTFEQEVSGSFSNTEKNSEPENDKKLYQELRDKLGMSNRGELKIAKLSVQPDFVKNLKESLVFQKNEEEEKVCKLPQKIENYVDKLTTDGEKRKGEKHVFEKVQAALELEKKIKGLSVGQQALQGVKVQDYEVVQQANSLDTKANVLIPYVDSPGGSLKQIEKSLPDERRDANVMRKEISDKERKEAEQKRKLEERAREREKDRISVEKTAGESCENVIAENREKPERISFERVAIDARKPIIDITVRSSSEVFERSEKVANEAKLRAERAAVERATTEARERAIERALAEQASVKAKRQAETLVNSKIGLKPTSNAYDVPNDLKSHSAGREEESPLRCKARQERCQRVVERAAKALEEKNMRDLLSQREQAERNRLAESLDVEVRRWSNGKEGNLRALLSTLQYILGHDSGWQPIPLTEVITAADARKAYRKATLYVHPDKLQQRGASIHHKYICEKVFDLLKDAWNKFNSEG